MVPAKRADVAGSRQVSPKSGLEQQAVRLDRITLKRNRVAGPPQRVNPIYIRQLEQIHAFALAGLTASRLEHDRPAQRRATPFILFKCPTMASLADSMFDARFDADPGPNKCLIT